RSALWGSRPWTMWWSTSRPSFTSGPRRRSAAKSWTASSWTTCRGSIPAPIAATRIPSASSAVINLLSPENGGQIIVADTKDWSYTIDGNDKSYGYIGQWVVYGFKNDGSAMFDTFKVWIPGTAATNLKEFELLAGNDSPTGKFESIGKFQPQNLRFFKDPWQEFRFPPVKAKYLKLNVISTYGSIPAAYEFQLLGVLEK